MRRWLTISFIIATLLWYALEVWAGTVSTHPFGRYEMLLQEGTPVAMGEILGIVRRQTGLPEYPLMLGVQRGMLDFGILGPGNRPIWIASSRSPWSVGVGAATARFIVERSARKGEGLILQVRRASRPGQVSLSVDLQRLERLLEGER